MGRVFKRRKRFFFSLLSIVFLYTVNRPDENELIHFLMALFIPGDTPHNDLYGEVPRERCTVFRLQVYKRVEISLAEVYERVGKCVISVNQKAQKD